MSPLYFACFHCSLKFQIHQYQNCLNSKIQQKKRIHDLEQDTLIVVGYFHHAWPNWPIRDKISVHVPSHIIDFRHFRLQLSQTIFASFSRKKEKILITIPFYDRNCNKKWPIFYHLSLGYCMNERSPTHCKI